MYNRIHIKIIGNVKGEWAYDNLESLYKSKEMYNI